MSSHYHDPDEIIVVRTKDGPRRVSRENWNRIQQEEAQERAHKKKRKKAKDARAARKKQRRR